MPTTCDRIKDDNVPIIYQSQIRSPDTPIAYSFINYTIFLLVFLGFLYIAPFVHFGFISFLFENLTKTCCKNTNVAALPPVVQTVVDFDSDTSQYRENTKLNLLFPIIKNVAGKITYYHSINLVSQNGVKDTYLSSIDDNNNIGYFFKLIGLNTPIDAFIIFVYWLTMFIIMGMGFSSESSDDQWWAFVDDKGVTRKTLTRYQRSWNAHAYSPIVTYASRRYDSNDGLIVDDGKVYDPTQQEIGSLNTWNGAPATAMKLGMNRNETTVALYKAVSLFMLILFCFMVPRIKVFYKNLADGKPMA